MRSKADRWCLGLPVASYRFRSIWGLHGVLWEYGFFIAAGVGVLAKGPVSLVLCGLIILLFVAVKKRWDLFWRLAFHPGVILAVTVFCLWYGSALWIGGEKFFGLQFIKENERSSFMAKAELAIRSRCIIISTFTLGLPWTLLLVCLLITSVERNHGRSRPFLGFGSLSYLSFFPIRWKRPHLAVVSAIG
jgi:4-amino-4-deoxy-L-arabinose transferase-like glycosyltransferase